MSACTAVAEESDQPLVVVVTPEGPNNQVTLDQATETAVFHIRSESGIGAAQLQLQSGEWPPVMLLRFHLAGLEEMALSYEDTTITLNISSRGDNEIWQSVTRDGHTEAVTAADPAWLAVSLNAAAGAAAKIPLEKGTIDVTVPPHFYETGETSFTIRWIDFYR